MIFENGTKNKIGMGKYLQSCLSKKLQSKKIYSIYTFYANLEINTKSQWL